MRRNLIYGRNGMGGINRNAGSNLKLRNSGLLNDELKTFKIRKVEDEVYTLIKGENVIILDVKLGKRA
jgi:hypothetical protein